MAPSYSIMSAKELVKAFEGIHPLSEDDILRPRADAMRLFYKSFVAYALPRNRDQSMDDEILKSAPDTQPEALENALIFQSVLETLAAVDSPWFTLRDFLIPTPQRIGRLLSAFAAYRRFCDMLTSDMGTALEENGMGVELKQTVERNIDEVETQILSEDELIEKDERVCELVEAERDALKAKIQFDTKERDRVVEMASANQEILNKLNVEVLAEKVKAEGARQEAQNLRLQIAPSPGKLEAELKRVEESLEAGTEAKKGEVDRAQAILGKLALAKKVLEMLNSRLEKMVLAVSTADRYSKLKLESQSKVEAVEKVKEQREYLENKVERIPQEDAIRAKKQETRNNEVEGLVVDLESAKRVVDVAHKELLQGENAFFEEKMMVQKEFQEDGGLDYGLRQLHEERINNLACTIVHLKAQVSKVMLRMRKVMNQ